MGGATGGMGKLEDVAILVDGLAIVASLGEGGLLPELLVLGVVDGAEEGGAAVLGTGHKVDRHDGLDPVTARELKHIITTGVAARSGLDVLLRGHGLQVRSGIGGGDDEQLIDKGLDVLHAGLEVVDGVLVLELEVGHIVVNTGNDEVTELTEAHEDVLMATVEQIEATDGVHLALLPSLGEVGLEGMCLVNEVGDAVLELGQNLTIEEGVSLVKLGQLLLADHGTGALVVLLEDLAECGLVEAEEFQKEVQLTVEGAEGLDGIDVVLEVLGLAHPAVLVLEPGAVGGNTTLVATGDGDVRGTAGGRGNAGGILLAIALGLVLGLGRGRVFGSLPKSLHAILQRVHVIDGPGLLVSVESLELVLGRFVQLEEYLGVGFVAVSVGAVAVGSGIRGAIAAGVLERLLHLLVIDRVETPLLDDAVAKSLAELHFGFDMI